MFTFTNPSFEETANKEWLVTNGIGGYASATINGSHSRRYHGLLVAALNPPTQRQVQLLKMETELVINPESSYELSTNQYPGVIHPQGYQYLTAFARDPLPRFSYEVAERQLDINIFMVNGSNTTILEYRNTGPAAFGLRLTPLFVDRDYHALFAENPEYNYYYVQDNNLLTIFSRYGAQPLYLKFSQGSFDEQRYWYKNLEYQKEAYRGLEKHEDAYAIGQINMEIGPQESGWIMCTLEPTQLTEDPAELKAAELQRLKDLVAKPKTSGFIRDLTVAADQFIVRRASTDSYSILAGYHWFTDWGRDTMIAIRGLGIALGRQEVSRSILGTFLDYLSEGMLPNRFPDHAGEQVEYNTIDATLWLFVAMYDYQQHFADDEFITEKMPLLTEIIQAHLAGTRYHIHVTEEGFLQGGQEGIQLTWMDARIEDDVVTPRWGCPVEIQALWYNALQIYAHFANKVTKEADTALVKQCRKISAQLEKHFPTRFLNDAGYLNDVYHPDSSVDERMRPNQIFALSLPFPLLEKTARQSVLQQVTEHLYTPFGLRTLAPDDPDFKAVYKGDRWQRDHAYHQGTVWPFLLDAYWTAYLRQHNFSQSARKKMRAELRHLEEHFYQHDGIHCVSEIFDGAEPAAGRGTIQQAWSVSALLRLLLLKEY